mmetsp:Transcript_17607/g.57095  ORF Transcript_17607/g.57095 Transcript_17607/m.57095 type:complete len:246 (-) Transcript_17607:3798-4535(-)
MFPDYKKHREQLVDFILNYREADNVKPLYLEEVQRLHDQGSRTFQVELDKVAAFTSGSDLVQHMVSNSKTYVRMLFSILETLVNELGDMSTEVDRALPSTFGEPQITIPYFREVYMVPPTGFTCRAVRSLRASDIGSLVKIRGIVTRTSDVIPSAQVVTYVCDMCGQETWQSVRNQHQFSPNTACSYCYMRHVNGKLHARSRGSNFVKYQELRLQELPEQVPIGHIPCGLAIRCNGNLTRVCVPG